MHTDSQDVDSEAWQKLLELVDVAASTGAETFAPGRELGEELWGQIITLPPSIATLKGVRVLHLYGSNLVRIPPEIGEMESLEEFVPYTSYRLHWFPYEITRCRNLCESTISTRALYGNYKFRPPFPRLYDSLDWYPEATPVECSVCRTPLLDRVLRRWISLKIATDVVPLLVNACSEGCIEALPEPPPNYVTVSHSGGLGVEQPPPWPQGELMDFDFDTSQADENDSRISDADP